MHLGLRARVPFPAEYKGFTLLRTHGRVYALPPGAQVRRIMTTSGLLDRHPAVLSAATLDEVRRLVDGYDLSALVPEIVGHAEGFDFVRHRGNCYAVPQAAGDLDLDVPEDRQHAGVISGKNLEELERTVRGNATGFPVEFAGWLPIFAVSGNCGAHPQFKHTAAPPAIAANTRSCTGT